MPYDFEEPEDISESHEANYTISWRANRKSMLSAIDSVQTFT